MNFKSFPGPLPHFSVGGAAVRPGRQGGVAGDAIQPDFWGPQHASVEGTPATEAPRLVPSRCQWGRGAPAAC